MNTIFRMDGPLNRIGSIIYYLIVANILWVIFSLPLFTAGASTTALFYVIGKVLRDGDVSTIKDFWKSFKLNFKQSTFVWILMLAIYGIIYINITNINIFGSMSKFILPVQIAILIEIVVITIYIFPILSRYEMTTKNLIGTSLFLGNRHFVTTLICIIPIAAIVGLLFMMPELFILIPVSLCALYSSYFIQGIFKKYMPDEQKH
ncbi:MAG TPA: DUF624 domain-containing protein [Clostridia bacterium]|nr:DUF624 domain-containing protein [Clostridia bacterium]